MRKTTATTATITAKDKNMKAYNWRPGSICYLASDVRAVPTLPGRPGISHGTPMRFVRSERGRLVTASLSGTLYWFDPRDIVPE